MSNTCPAASRSATRRPDRREFGRQIAAAALLSVPACHSETMAGPSRAASQPLRVGAIGVWNRGRDNLIAVQQERIVALSDVDGEYLERIAERYPQAAKYRDFREMFDREDLDAVVISTPDHTHFPAAIRAVARGIHVYCERPLVRTLDELKTLVQAARQSGSVTQMGNQHRASDGYRRVVELVRSGGLGEIRDVHAWTDRPLWPQGLERRPPRPVPENLDWDLWLGPSPERPYAEGYHPIEWHGWWDFGTGALGDMGPHLLDSLFWALDLKAPTRVEATCAPGPAESAPRWSVVRFLFPESNDRPSVRLTWYDGEKRPDSNITSVAQPPANGVMLIGSRARLFVPERGQPPRVVPGKGASQKGVTEQGDADRGGRVSFPEPSLPRPDSHHQQWLDACRGHAKADSDFVSVASLVETCLLGNVAIRAGQPLEWDAKSFRVTNVPDANRFLGSPSRSGWSLP